MKSKFNDFYKIRSVNKYTNEQIWLKNNFCRMLWNILTNIDSLKSTNLFKFEWVQYTILNPLMPRGTQVSPFTEI